MSDSAMALRADGFKARRAGLLSGEGLKRMRFRLTVNVATCHTMGGST